MVGSDAHASVIRRGGRWSKIRGMIKRLTVVAVTLLTLGAAVVRAEVTRVEVATRADIGSSGYEKIVATVHFAVDPRDPHNRDVVDLDKAPRNAAGLVEFSSDLYVLRPKDATRANGAALVEVSNRGSRGALREFNRGSSAG